MRVLITRPREDAEPLAALLAGHGIDSLIEPLLAIAYLDELPDLRGVQAILITSANGIRALARLTPRRDLPILAVGDASARAARELGFVSVDSAGGDVADLSALVGRTCDPAAGPLLHVAGSAVAGDLAGLLERMGFAYRRAVLYTARTASSLSPACVAALQGDSLDGVLFFSPRTAQTFVTLVAAADLTAALRRLTAYCLSQQVAMQAGKTGWQHLAIAAQPETAALLDLLADPRPGGAA